jgi:hypothetical protein
MNRAGWCRGSFGYPLLPCVFLVGVVASWQEEYFVFSSGANQRTIHLRRLPGASGAPRAVCGTHCAALLGR